MSLGECGGKPLDELSDLTRERDAMRARAEAAEADWQAVEAERDALLQLVREASEALRPGVPTHHVLDIRAWLQLADAAIAKAEGRA